MEAAGLSGMNARTASITATDNRQIRDGNRTTLKSVLMRQKCTSTRRSLSFALLISDLGSIARAANILGMKQATLSRKLTALESRVGVRFAAK